MDPMLYEILGNDSHEFQASTKTEEEIKKLTLEENMSEVKRTVHILSRGQPIQKISVYMNLHKILMEPEGFNKILPLISEELLSQNEEIQKEAANSLIKLLKKNELEKTQVLQIFRICTSMLRTWNQAVLDAWALVFNQILQKVPYNVIAKEAEETLLSISEQSQHTMSKYIAAKMIGFIADNNIQNPGLLYDRAKILCQDNDAEVRRIMATEVMTKICHVVGTELTELIYLEKILTLLYDSDQQVKLATIDTLVEILDILSDELREKIMVNRFMELMASVNEEVMKRMSYHVGKIVYYNEEILRKNTTAMGQIQKTYKDVWGTHKNPEIRRNFIFNLPFMIQTFENRDYLKGLYVKALKDSDKQIRYTAISCLHEICKLMNPDEAFSNFAEIFDGLLKEDDPKIKEKLVKNFHEIAMVLQSRSGEDKVEESKDQREILKSNSKEARDYSNLFANLIAFGENIVSMNTWRNEYAFLDNLKKCIEYFEIRDIESKYVAFLIGRISKGVLEVKQLAMDHLVSFIEECHVSQITASIIKRIGAEFQASPSYCNRVRFLEIYQRFTQIFSRNFMRTYKLNDMAIKLANDKTPAVKMKFLEVAFDLRITLTQEDDGIILAQLKEAFNRLIADKNKEVAKRGLEVQRELSSLTEYFFDDLEEKDLKKQEREEALKAKEEKEIEEMKKRQQEELQKMQGDFPFSYGQLIANKKISGTKKVWGKEPIQPGKIGRIGLLNPSSTTPKMKSSGLDDFDRKPKSIIGSKINTGTNGLNMVRKKSESEGSRTGSTATGSANNGSLGDVDKKTPSIGISKDKERKSIVDTLLKMEIKTDPKDGKAQNKENTTKITKDPKMISSTIKKK